MVPLARDGNEEFTGGRADLIRQLRASLTESTVRNAYCADHGWATLVLSRERDQHSRC